MDQGYAAPTPPTTTGNAGQGISIAALVCGIISVAMSSVPFVSIVLSILGIVFGVKGRKIRKNGMATAGLVLGIIGLCFSVLYIVCVACLIVMTIQEGAFGEMYDEIYGEMYTAVVNALYHIL